MTAEEFQKIKEMIERDGNTVDTVDTVITLGALKIGEQVVNDIHRIANALEQIAMNTAPRPRA